MKNTSYKEIILLGSGKTYKSRGVLSEDNMVTVQEQ